MDQNPFAHLDLKQTEEAERKARAAHPYLFRLAELVVFIESPTEWIRDWRRRRAIGYDGKPRT